MIPIIYESTETTFNTNGLGRLRDAISCEVSETRNGIFECVLRYPVDGANYDLITPGRILGVTHDDTGDIQPFDIVGYERPIDGIVTFHCVHISYRLSGQVVWDASINSLAEAIDLFNNVAGTPFNFSADFTQSGYMAAGDGVPRSVRQMMGGIQGSVIDAYGGEWEFNKWAVTLHKARGTQRDFTIRYGVNLVDYQEDADYSGAYNSVWPYWVGTGDDGAPVVVRGTVVDTGRVIYNGRRVIAPLDLSEKFENKPTTAQLTSAATSYMNANRPDLPAQNIKVDFVRLQDMEEFAGFSPLLECQLCDTIKVVFSVYGAEAFFKIVKTTWDVLAGRYLEMELGQLSTSLAEALGISTTPESIHTINDFGIAGDLTVGGKISTVGKIYAGAQMVLPNNTGLRWFDNANPANEVTLEYFSNLNRFIVGNAAYPLVLNGDNAAIDASGNAAFDGTLTLSNHAGRVGRSETTDSGSFTLNSATGAPAQIAATKLTLPAGDYLIMAGVVFPSNATGIRRIGLGTTSIVGVTRDSTNALAGGYDTYLRAALDVHPSASTDYYIFAQQNSGSQLTVSYYWRVMRIA